MSKILSHDSLLVGFYLSKFSPASYENLGYGTQKATHEAAAQALNQKASNIKNMRDEFDPYYDSGRVGWYQKSKLSATRQAVKDLYEEFSEEELRKRVLQLLEPANSKPLFTSIEVKEIAPADRDVIEGDLAERKLLFRVRNKVIADECKARDKYTCRSCEFYYQNRIVECHHLVPLSISGTVKIRISDLITLCPTCHRLAHALLEKDIANQDLSTLLVNLKLLTKSKSNS